MSIWDALTGRKSSSPASSPATSGPPSSPAGSEAYIPSAFAAPPSDASDSFLKSSAFADPAQLHPLAGLNKDTLEYLSNKETEHKNQQKTQTNLPSRGFTDDLCYGTGVTYLSALSLGGAWGLQEGLRRSAGQPPKLRLNSVLN